MSKGSRNTMNRKTVFSDHILKLFLLPKNVLVLLINAPGEEEKFREKNKWQKACFVNCLNRRTELEF